MLLNSSYMTIENSTAILAVCLYSASLWKCSVKVVDVRSVQYRYFIGHPIVLSQQEIIVVREMEGKVRSADLKNQDSLTVDDGKFGIDENGTDILYVLFV